MTNNLGKTLKGRRRLKDLTLTQVSSAAGISVSHLGRIERGERFPSGHILRKLAEPLGFSEIELFRIAGLIEEEKVGEDNRIIKFKIEMMKEITDTLFRLLEKVDNL